MPSNFTNTSMKKQTYRFSQTTTHQNLYSIRRWRSHHSDYRKCRYNCSATVLTWSTDHVKSRQWPICYWEHLQKRQTEQLNSIRPNQRCSQPIQMTHHTHTQFIKMSDERSDRTRTSGAKDETYSILNRMDGQKREVSVMSQLRGMVIYAHEGKRYIISAGYSAELQATADMCVPCRLNKPANRKEPLLRHEVPAQRFSKVGTDDAAGQHASMTTTYCHKQRDCKCLLALQLHSCHIL